jgi:hypothetical protein
MLVDVLMDRFNELVDALERAAPNPCPSDFSKPSILPDSTRKNWWE